MKKLTDKEIQDKLKKFDDWTIEKDQLHRVYTFKSFGMAMGFVTRVAILAESIDHHPDIDIRYNKVILNLSTHSAGGITEKDFELIHGIDAV